MSREIGGPASRSWLRTARAPPNSSLTTLNFGWDLRREQTAAGDRSDAGNTGRRGPDRWRSAPDRAEGETGAYSAAAVAGSRGSGRDTLAGRARGGESRRRPDRDRHH